MINCLPIEKRNIEYLYKKEQWCTTKKGLAATLLRRIYYLRSHHVLLLIFHSHKIVSNHLIQHLLHACCYIFSTLRRRLQY